jgi:hypothetical protein
VAPSWLLSYLLYVSFKFFWEIKRY